MYNLRDFFWFVAYSQRRMHNYSKISIVTCAIVKLLIHVLVKVLISGYHCDFQTWHTINIWLGGG